ncbi:MAG: DUF952 domain-containing protein [Cyanobacteria bacterium]|nr:DUF952 domain-containing protein [Cyanobacteriota bacterium]
MTETAALPILYSFRRCPYAIRARLALASAAVAVEIREVALACKPPELLAASARGTVPVLVPPSLAMPVQPLAESLEIMRWGLSHHDPQDWLRQGDAAAQAAMAELLTVCDGPFKHHLDRFNYASRYGAAASHTEIESKAVAAAEREAHRQAALEVLRGWNARLRAAAPAAGADGWLLGSRPALADWALMPFVRQFRLADVAAFDAAGDLALLRAWLQRLEQGPELAAVLSEPWGPRQPWLSPSWLYHLALPDEWAEARCHGEYRRSSRGLSLEQVGFIHASYAPQLAGTHRRFYGDVPGVLLLTIDPGRLAAAGVAVRAEAAPGSGELFPHLYGPLPLSAVLAVEPWRPVPVLQEVAA